MKERIMNFISRFGILIWENHYHGYIPSDEEYPLAWAKDDFSEQEYWGI